MLTIYNSLTRKIEVFKPLAPPKVTMYTCGPTVYDYATIGNWRTYVLSDLLVRTLQYFGYQVTYIMNITDVGHLTGDNLGDADIGEDRLARAARQERKTAWEIANFYTQEFIRQFTQLNLQPPQQFTKATEHIKEQIELVQRIEKAGFTYRIEDGIYFSVRAYERAGNKYGQLSSMRRIKEGARVEINPQKQDPRDFALWKFSKPAEKRDMEWESPWGRGFPGWHIECSAMSMRYLGEQFDLHVGGEDLRNIHHPNEIAQAEAATGKRPFVKYWVHGAFLLVDGGRMGKSLGNAYTLQDIEKRGFHPLDLRYFYFTGHYRRQLNFTWEALEAAAQARKKLLGIIAEINQREIDGGIATAGAARRPDRSSRGEDYQGRFEAAISNDFNLPEALAVLWQVVKAELQAEEKYRLVLTFDKVLGLQLSKIAPFALKHADIPEEVRKLVAEREKLRKKKRWAEADNLRKKIRQQGYIIEDRPTGTKLKLR